MINKVLPVIIGKFRFFTILPVNLKVGKSSTLEVDYDFLDLIQIRGLSNPKKRTHG
jgi:hypothetical protein